MVNRVFLAIQVFWGSLAHNPCPPQARESMSGLSALAVLAVLGLAQAFSPNCVPSTVAGSNSQCTVSVDLK